ncbi:acyl-CoA carboxylase subunit beta [Microvenator marinus]|uniref:Acyl-CoA carboxylase subunit beta n=1 Tax=Microvenator marinus TaxID=2600177 RepID=A0A5B8XVA2_9DELT|nr:acyl-CoA carboxylase subunit beta [Microvenator marinus]QED28013.1 acyl-CoA carboxylase subunit beta [Microvenator marinus]
MSQHDEILREREAEVLKGGKEKYHAKNSVQGKLFCRERLNLLLDDGLEIEDGKFANINAGDLPADGVITGVGKIQGRRVAVMANDSTVKAGSWGWRTVEKIIRIQETAERLKIPMLYLVDSAGARITDQIEMFPGRRGAGKIFYNQVRLSGFVPQICLLFGPSAAGGAYIPAFCDVVVMVNGNASMYLGSPRMAEMVIGEKVTLEEMGGADMHCRVSGCGDVLVDTEQEAIEFCKDYLSYLPSNCHEEPPFMEPKAPQEQKKSLDELIPENQNKAFDMKKVIKHLVDDSEFLEIKKLFAQELITAFARIDGRSVGIVASQPKHLGGVLFVNSADKAARFINLCDAFGVPLIFLADVPGFMIGTKVEREGIIRHGAKMISAVSEATVPKLSVVVRKAYGAGLYAMCGPGFEPDVSIALPEAMIAVMGPEAAVNAVFANKIEAMPEDKRPAYVEELREEFKKDIDIFRLASEMVVDHIVPKEHLRDELKARLNVYETKEKDWPLKKRAVTPV